ncbi:L-2-amino-thiazoline-4-carboxylic acid hydrolase [Gemmatimonadota bacterium]
MNTGDSMKLNRRELLTRTAPACAMACLALWKAPEVLAAGVEVGDQDVHKFDELRDAKLSPRSAMRMQYSQFFEFVKTLREQIGDQELIRLLNLHSTAIGQRQGEEQAKQFADTQFQTFVAQFRPPRYAGSLSHEVVEDTENAFELRVTECIWATVFRVAGLDGEIGHAAVCNMDYTWPTAFNPNFRMERDHTLMQGHDHCNHRYLQIAKRF